MSESQVRQNFHEDCEEALNRQINMELHASYYYMSLAFHFDRDDVALPGFHAFFKRASDEERGHAMKLMRFVNKRGGRIVLSDIGKPDVHSEVTAAGAMELALELEKKCNQSLLDIQALAASKEDANMCDFIGSQYLQEQVDSIKKFGDHLTNLNRVGEGLGVYLYDKDLK